MLESGMYEVVKKSFSSIPIGIIKFLQPSLKGKHEGH